MSELVKYLDGLIWSPALIYLCLGAGLYFSIRTRFMQMRGFVEMLRLIASGQTSAAGVSSFQALAMSLSGRIGIGNIAGVATAITAGGPGAIFWMWVMALLGASTSYIECTLAQIYKQKDDHGQYRGGPAYYIEKAMGQKWYAVDLRGRHRSRHRLSAAGRTGKRHRRQRRQRMACPDMALRRRHRGGAGGHHFRRRAPHRHIRRDRRALSWRSAT